MPRTQPSGTIVTAVGTGIRGFSGDGGPAGDARLDNVYAVARAPDGALVLCDTDNHRIRRIDRRGRIATIVGSGRRGYDGDGGPATQAALDQPYDLAWDRDGNLCFVELGNHCVRRVDRRTGIVATIAGDGVPGFSGDGGPAVRARLRQPHSIAVDPDGHLHICDIGNHRIRRVDRDTGRISTWAGTGAPETAPDGAPLRGSPLHGPRALVFGRDGRGFLALREGNAVLLLDPKADTLRRIAGTGKAGFTGNGGPARDATLSGPKAIALGPGGDIYLADTESHSLRVVRARTGILDLLVGDGMEGDGPDGDDPRRCRLARPHGVWVDRDGAVWIGDSENHRVRLWSRRPRRPFP